MRNLVKGVDDCRGDISPGNVILHKEVIDKLHEVYVAKNKDYGSSATKTFEEFGLISYAIRISDKLNRLKEFVRCGEMMVSDESIIDTLLDLANYSIMAVIDMKTTERS